MTGMGGRRERSAHICIPDADVVANGGDDADDEIGDLRGGERVHILRPLHEVLPRGRAHH